MDILSYMKSHLLCLDGGMGTLLQQKGLKPGESPVIWNLEHPEVIRDVHRAYFDAGSHVVCTNTFGADLLHFERGELRRIVFAAVKNAREAAEESTGRQPKWVALDIGPLGKLLRPMGDLAFEEAVRVFSYTVEQGVQAGADLIMLETFTDLAEARAALLAAKEKSHLPVFVSNAYQQDGRLLTGADPVTVCNVLCHMGADAVGVNCSFGPEALLPVIDQYLQYASVAVLFKPNAGLPRVSEGKTVFDVLSESFALSMQRAVNAGVRLYGGCCGTTPEYIKACTARLQDGSAKDGTLRAAIEASGTHPEASTAQSTAHPMPDTVRCHAPAVSSATRTVFFEDRPLLIGERINPTGKKRLRQALSENDMPFILEEALKQAEKGVHILDVNVGAPGIDEKTVLPRLTGELQGVTDLPLQLDTADPAAMEKALRAYCGRALINSVNGKQESMDAFFPLAKKYGGILIALTLDENGIPPRAEERLRIAERILQEAARYGLGTDDLIFDPLVLTVSTDPASALETLHAVRLIREKLHCRVSLGVSNISFGLPVRDGVNSVFFTMAMQQGLSAAIMNPYSEDMMNAWHSFLLLNGMDEGCRDYIAFAQGRQFLPGAASGKAEKPSGTGAEADTLQQLILHGMKLRAAQRTEEMLACGTLPMTIIQTELIPALDMAGKAYEEKRFFLPQLLASAEAVSLCFEKLSAACGEGPLVCDRPVILATVKGDIHDIGKNIVGMLLKNYGFRVIDLGKDVPAEAVVRAIRENNAFLCGLSALMTTTVPAMEETIRLVKREAPLCRIIVGGAVLTADYADRIGADAYGKDAMATVRYAEKLIGSDV